MKSNFRSALATGLAVVVASATVLTIAASPAVAATPPFEPDTSNQIGTLAFYDAAGAQITTGSTTANPFSKYAVTSNDDPVTANNGATLYGYLPVSGVAPGNWSGEQLSSTTAFPVTGSGVPASISGQGPHRPVITNAPGDTILNQLAQDIPNTAPAGNAYQGLYQLRVLTQGNLKWWAADIQIIGPTWTQVYPTTSSTVPGTPTIGTATAGNASATVTFTAPSGNGGAAITGYTATANPGGATGSISGATATPITVVNLTNGTAYTFTVHANNSVGSSPESAASNPVAPAAGTTTTLVASPAGQAYAGASVTFTATVNPSAAGAVQFKDGTTNLGSAVTVTSGAASTSTSSLTAGTHNITAEFTPTDSAAFGSSTSAALSYKVIGVPSWKPTLVGSHRVAYTDSCIASFDNATAVTYAWLVNGSPVSGATGSSFKVPEAYWHQTLTCRVTATNPAGSQVGTSAGAVVGTGPALVPTVRPVLTGQHVHGQYEYCSHGTWNPAAVTYTYQWFVGTLAISRATSYRYAVPLSLKGKTINCVVKAHRSAAWTDGAFRTAAVRITA